MKYLPVFLCDNRWQNYIKYAPAMATADCTQLFAMGERLKRWLEIVQSYVFFLLELNKGCSLCCTFSSAYFRPNFCEVEGEVRCLNQPKFHFYLAVKGPGISLGIAILHCHESILLVLWWNTGVNRLVWCFIRLSVPFKASFYWITFDRYIFFVCTLRHRSQKLELKFNFESYQLYSLICFRKLWCELYCNVIL